MVTARQKRQAKREGKLDVALAEGEKKAGTKEKVTKEEAYKKPKPKAKVGETIDLSGDRKAKKSEKKAALTKKLTKSAKLLGGTAAALTGVGFATGAIGGGAAAIGAGTGRVASITRTASTLGRGATSVSKRMVIGRPAVSKVDKLFGTAGRFASNSKSSGLTSSYLKKIGTGITSPAALMGAIGTYPFASFIKEEALQTLDFAVKTAAETGDIEGMRKALDEQREILEAAPSIIESLPFGNLITKLEEFFKAAAIKLEINEKLYDQLAGDEPTQFEKEGEELRQTRLEERARDAEYFRLIREGRYDEAQTLLDTELQGGQEI